MLSRSYFVYILTNCSETLYVGVTNDLYRRMAEHKQGLMLGFSKKYKLKKLIYYEMTQDILSAIAREKQIKGGGCAPRRLGLLNLKILRGVI